MRFPFIVLVALFVFQACATQSEAPKSTDYAKLIVGKWLGSTKFQIYYPDGTWGVQRHEEAPVDKDGRYWKIEGNKLTLNYPGGSVTQTIVHIDKSKFTTRDEGYSSTRDRVSMKKS